MNQPYTKLKKLAYNIVFLIFISFTISIVIILIILTAKSYTKHIQSNTENNTTSIQNPAKFADKDWQNKFYSYLDTNKLSRCITFMNEEYKINEQAFIIIFNNLILDINKKYNLFLNFQTKTLSFKFLYQNTTSHLYQQISCKLCLDGKEHKFNLNYVWSNN